MSEDVDIVLSVLEEAGYERLPTPLIVAGSKFEFEGAVKGTRQSHDLVVVAGRSTQPRHLARLLSALGRTLDQAQSRRPVSLVLLDASPERSVLADLERLARVLVVEEQPPTPAAVRRAVAVLLPLELPATAFAGREPLDEVIHALGRSRTEDHDALIEAARFGPDAVRSALIEFVDGAVSDAPSQDSDP